MDNNFKKMMDEELKRAACKVSLEEIKANIDQMTMAGEAIAIVMKTYYDGFIKAGFDTTQAMYLTSNMGSTVIALAMTSSSGKGDGK